MTIVAAAFTVPIAARGEEIRMGHITFGDLEAVVILVADNAGNDGWMPLAETVARYNIDESFVDTALDAGSELSCIRTKANGIISLQYMND